ncbi:hypothetical protein DICSQDRAFT_179690 [Dichomitus squalens LYAD-421 SS1]|uniref:uncharacterized protein n=1 Tax=Dichomitus squalens (strain LYAD-421) TaxID=732165 RepID=UPI0004411CDB|nr:uncharacterized protein DICSQDRAFT_179690 [Dichomitus squalens LYAD-421 SS1]EJF63031.1 hypothetical protein DICSQDRAFT_179690 [Dichomitus squalens LYAD-421 SS1]
MSSNPSGRSLPFDPSLLQPIVRSKRTPIACTECRRRQVKCSGTMPRCERCTKKNIECTYVSLSEQRGVSASTGGSISRSGTPSQSQSQLGSSPAGHPHARVHGYGSSTLARSSTPLGWQAGVQGYSAGSAYPAPQGWQASSPNSSPVSPYTPQGAQASQNQSYAGVPMAYPQGYSQQAAFAQGGGMGQAGDMFVSQGYAQQGQQVGTSYNAYGHAVPAGDPTYAYQAAQLATMAGGDQQTAAYMGQFAPQQQVFFDPASGQMIPADVASQWAENPHMTYQDQTYPGAN